MTTTYDRDLAARLIAEARKRQIRLRSVHAAVSVDGQMIDAMADQLEAAQARIAELEARHSGPVTATTAGDETHGRSA